MTDRYTAYDTVLDEQVNPERTAAGCVAHARRKPDELAKEATTALADEAKRRFARIYQLEGEFAALGDAERQAARQELAKRLWDKLKKWLEPERRLVIDRRAGGRGHRRLAHPVAGADTTAARRPHQQQPP